MIQAIMLVTLGFLTASLIGFVIAPSLWSRAYRLSRKQLEMSLPLSLSEIEAAQDRLRASYAVKLRRLETALAGTKQKAAIQLVDNSRLQMQIAALKDTIGDLNLKLSERQNASTVLEQTITRRFPELESEITGIKSQLFDRNFELQDLTNRLSRKDEGLEAAQRAAAAYQDELTRLRESLEKKSADRGGRRLRRPSQWNLDDYRAEYDRLNLDLSKLRQQLAQFQDRELHQVGLIKGELQNLAELILASAQPKTEVHTPQRMEVHAGKRITGPDVRRDRPLPWPQSAPQPVPAIEKPVEASTLAAESQTATPTREPEHTEGSNGRVAASVAAKEADTVLNSSVIRAPIDVGSPKAAAASATRIMREITERAGIGHDSDADAKPSKGSAQPEAVLSSNGKPTANSEKPFADARGLRALSELMAISPANGGTPAAATSQSSIAEEAKAGQIIDMESVVVADEKGDETGAHKQSRKLLDRLRKAATSPAEAEK